MIWKIYMQTMGSNNFYFHWKCKNLLLRNKCRHYFIQTTLHATNEKVQNKKVFFDNIWRRENLFLLHITHNLYIYRSCSLIATSTSKLLFSSQCHHGMRFSEVMIFWCALCDKKQKVRIMYFLSSNSNYYVNQFGYVLK